MSHNSANAFNRPFQNYSLSFESAGSLFQLKQEHAVYSPTLNEIPLRKWISSNTCVCVEGGGRTHELPCYQCINVHVCTLQRLCSYCTLNTNTNTTLETIQQSFLLFFFFIHLLFRQDTTSSVHNRHLYFTILMSFL